MAVQVLAHRRLQASRRHDGEYDAEVIEFVMKLARALHNYGATAHQLEEALVQITQRMGLEAQFFSTPTSVMASFGPVGRQQSSLIRTHPGDVDLGKMASLDELASRVSRGELSVPEGSLAIDAIVRAPAPYPEWAMVLGFAVASAAASTLFGGGLIEVVVASAIGLIIGILSLVAARFATINRLFVPVGALAASLFSVLMGALMPAAFSPYVTTVAGLIVLLPGLTLTLAMNELATFNLVSGASRMTLAMLVFLEMAFGVALGLRLGGAITGELAPTTLTPLAPWIQMLTLLLGAASFAVLFRAHLRDIGWIIAAAFLGFCGTRVGAMWLGVELGALIGGVLVGVGSNLYARLLDRPSTIPMVPGLILLVPGSVGFKSVSYLLERDILTGIETAFSMALVASALVAGVLMANLLVPPRKAL